MSCRARCGARAIERKKHWTAATTCCVSVHPQLAVSVLHDELRGKLQADPQQLVSAFGVRQAEPQLAPPKLQVARVTLGATGAAPLPFAVLLSAAACDQTRRRGALEQASAAHLLVPKTPTTITTIPPRADDTYCYTYYTSACRRIGTSRRSQCSTALCALQSRAPLPF